MELVVALTSSLRILLLLADVLLVPRVDELPISELLRDLDGLVDNALLGVVESELGVAYEQRA